MFKVVVDTALVSCEYAPLLLLFKLDVLKNTGVFREFELDPVALTEPVVELKRLKSPPRPSIPSVPGADALASWASETDELAVVLGSMFDIDIELLIMFGWLCGVLPAVTIRLKSVSFIRFCCCCQTFIYYFN